LGKLIYFYDDNLVTIEGFTSLAFSEDVPKRFEAYGWHTLTVSDGNDLQAIDEAIRQAQAVTDKPSLISVKTVIGFGMPTAGTRKAHSDAPGEEAVRETKRHLGWPEDKHFFVPDEALPPSRGHSARRATEREWESLLGKMNNSIGLSSLMAHRHGRWLPADGRSHLPKFEMPSRWLRSGSGGD
jgi:transketolase